MFPAQSFLRKMEPRPTFAVHPFFRSFRRERILKSHLRHAPASVLAPICLIQEVKSWEMRCLLPPHPGEGALPYQSPTGRLPPPFIMPSFILSLLVCSALFVHLWSLCFSPPWTSCPFLDNGLDHTESAARGRQLTPHSSVPHYNHVSSLHVGYK